MHQLKFIVAAKANGSIIPLGGEWSAADGKDPTKEATQVKTAIRHCKELVGLDLSSCKNWNKFLEVQYRRKNGATHHTVILVPDVWKHFGDLSAKTELKKAVVQEEKEVEVEEEVEDEEVPAEAPKEVKEGETAETEAKTEEEPKPKKMKKIKKKVTKTVDKVILKPHEITLAALMELNTFDTSEATVEAALFGLAFDEMLSYFNAKRILTILREEKKESDDQATIVKRKREEEAVERQAQMEKNKEEMESKKRKLADDQKVKDEEKAKKEEEAAKRLEEEKDMTEEDKEKRHAENKEREEAAKAKEEEEKKAREEEAKKKREDAIKEREEEAKKKREEEQAKREAQDAEDKARGYRIVKQTITHLNEEMAAPFQYFDRPLGNSGQIRRDVMEGILHALGELTQREVDSLLRCIGLPPDRSNQPLFYRRVASHTVIEDKQIPIVAEKPKEEPKKEEEKPEEKAEEQSVPMEEDAPAEKTE